MFIDRNIDKYKIEPEASIIDALRKIDANNGRIITVVDEGNLIHGLATNGDLLRWLINSEEPDIKKPITEIMNREFLFVEEDEDYDRISSLLEKVLFVPIVDKHKHLIAVATRDNVKEEIEIGDSKIGKDHPCYVIAEIGNNHNGSLDMAKHLIDACVHAGADCAKFQMRDLDSLYVNKGNADDIGENLGSQYTLDLLSRFQLSNEELFEAFDYCKERGIQPLCTPWDEKSLELLESYGMPAYKVASADLTNHELLRAIARTGKPMICSTGMSSEDEIKRSVEFLKQNGAAYVLLHCNSTYPAPLKDINMSYMARLGQTTNSIVGYSGHERGVNVSIGAAAMGARVIERHITNDRSLEGNDHKVSLLPEEFREMVQGIRDVEESMGSSAPRQLSQGEMMNRVTLAKSLVINCDLKKGETISAEMVEVKSPGKGLQPIYREELVGRQAKHDFKSGDFFYPNDIVDEVVEPRDYKFNRPWGIPVRYHDFDKLLDTTNLDLVEFHLSYKDLEVDHHQFFEGTYPIDFVVHSPELFTGDHTLDLCSSDVEYRNHSIKELQRVIDITRELKQYFPTTTKPCIITNVGGFTSDGFLSKEQRQQCYTNLEYCLSQLDMEGVEIIPQTMPPFPWHFGGQQFHNIFVDGDETAEFCERNSMRICLDVSHSKLACTHHHWSFFEFLQKTAPHTAHLHMADSESTGGEGLQIGEGEIDFPVVSKVLDEFNKDASFIPEIWQGHENNGEGFWIALERLEPFM